MDSSTVFTTAPEGFIVMLAAAGCYCEYQGKFLLLKREFDAPQPNTWCLPGGKIEAGESPRAAMIRELQEEIGVGLEEAELQEVGLLYMRQSGIDYLFYTFRYSFDTEPTIFLGFNEHQEARWVTLLEALALPLIGGGEEVLRYCAPKN